ncbi:MAG: hypothetical protein AABW86_01820 [Candidatus Micrarchaeota archaeon]
MKTLLVVVVLVAFAMVLFGCIGQIGKTGASGVAGSSTKTPSASSSLPPLELSEDELPIIEEPDFSFESTDNAITMPEK